MIRRPSLAYYAERFETVELNNSFYRQPSLEQFKRWRSAVPDGFAYAVKLNRFITHIKRLNVDAPTIARAALAALRECRLGLCVIDTSRCPTRLAVTSDLVYVRFHGPGRLYASTYDDTALQEWAARIREWRDSGHDVLAYFNNDERACARRDAVRLRELVG